MSRGVPSMPWSTAATSAGVSTTGRRTGRRRFAPIGATCAGASAQVPADAAPSWAGIRTTVLVEGESGVGKELIATALHEASSACDGPFVYALREPRAPAGVGEVAG